MQIFEKKIREILVKQNVVNGSRFLLLAILLVLLTFNVFFAVYFPSQSSQGALFLFAISLKIFLALAVIYLVLQANRSLLSHYEAAKYLDLYNEDKADTYQNAYELKQELGKSEILKRIIKKADKKAKNQIIETNRRKLMPLLIITIIVILFSGLLFIMKPVRFSQSYNFFKLNELPQAQHKKIVEVMPGDLSLLRNSKLEIEVMQPEPEVEHHFFYKLEKNWREEKLSEHKIVFDNLDFSFSYFVQTPYAVSDTFEVTVFELPIVQNLRIRYDYPKYSGLKQHTESDANGNIKALEGTFVTLEITANNSIEKAQIFYSDGEVNTLERIGRKSFKTKFQVLSNRTYHIKLIDILNNESRKIERSITATKDRKPEIKIIRPGTDTLLTQNMLLPLKIFASDDYGLKNMELKFSINYEEEKKVTIQNKFFQNIVTKDFVFDLSNLVLIPGDKVTYWTEITDNSPKNQKAVSRKYTARFPSIEEIYKEIEEEEKKKSEILNNTLKKSEELQKEFEEKRRELMKKEEFDWEDKKQLEKLLDKQKNLSEDVDKVAEDFKNLMEKFEDNKALSSETLEKMKKIQELMEEISNEDLQKAMEEMRKKMENLDPDVMQKAMENFKFSMEDFSEKLEQTIKLLEEIKKEQAVQKALEIAEEMEEMQSELNKRTEDEALTKEQLSKQQKEISEKLDNLKEQLEKIDELLDEQKDVALMEELQKLMEKMKEDDLASDLENSEQMLSEGKMQEASESQQKAMQKMKSMKQMLQSMQQCMSSCMMADAGEIIQKTIRRLLIYTQFQEEAMSKFKEDPFVILKDEVAVFEGIDLILRELYATPMIVLVIGPKFMYDANFTNTTFRELFQYINEAKNQKVNGYLGDIVKGINLMIFDLMQAQDNMQQGGGSGGMQSMMQSLQQMGQQQLMMNMMTQQLMQQLSQDGKMSSQGRRQAQELASDQQRIAENLKRMLQTNQEAQKQSASINKMIEEIESVVHDLKRGRLDSELIQKQERILSRLLDAQKSIHKREFSKKRKSEISENEDWLLPEEIKLKFEKMRKKALLEEDYKDFPKEYQELIKEYLKLLNERYDEE